MARRRAMSASLPRTHSPPLRLAAALAMLITAVTAVMKLPAGRRDGVSGVNDIARRLLFSPQGSPQRAGAADRRLADEPPVHADVATVDAPAGVPVSAGVSCPFPPQQCNTSSVSADNCGFTGNGSTAVPAFCAYNSFSTRTGIWSGNCTAASTATRSDVVYNSSCAYSASNPFQNQIFSCASYEAWGVAEYAGTDEVLSSSLECNAGARACRYRSTATLYNGLARTMGSGSAVGDPCADANDCISSLRCRSPQTSCSTPNGGIGTTCVGAEDCGIGAYCNFYTRACVPRLPLGAACSWYSAGGTPSSPFFNPCGVGAFCFDALQPFGSAVSGKCTAYNSLPAGATFRLDSLYTSQWQMLTLSALYMCASGAAVPLPASSTNAYPGSNGVCVSSFDLTLAGQACSSCSPQQGQYPLAASGHVMCAPLLGGGCGYIPSFPLAFTSAPAYVAMISCLTQSASGARPCTPFYADGTPRTVVGTCGYYACYSSWTAALMSLDLNRFWNNASIPGWAPTNTLDSCVQNVITSSLAFAASGNNGCSLPPAFATRGWSCTGGVGPAPAPFPIVLPSPAPGTSPSPSPSSIPPSTSAVPGASVSAVAPSVTSSPPAPANGNIPTRAQGPLSTGGIAGVTVGAVVFAALVAAAIFALVRWRRSSAVEGSTWVAAWPSGEIESVSGGAGGASGRTGPTRVRVMNPMLSALGLDGAPAPGATDGNTTPGDAAVNPSYGYVAPTPTASSVNGSYVTLSPLATAGIIPSTAVDAPGTVHVMNMYADARARALSGPPVALPPVLSGPRRERRIAQAPVPVGATSPRMQPPADASNPMRRSSTSQM